MNVSHSVDDFHALGALRPGRILWWASLLEAEVHVVFTDKRYSAVAHRSILHTRRLKNHNLVSRSLTALRKSFSCWRRPRRKRSQARSSSCALTTIIVAVTDAVDRRGRFASDGVGARPTNRGHSNHRGSPRPKKLKLKRPVL